ncbi:MAG: type II toxin-antitoxin system RelE/ParE family toxin [Alloprevotella sp.]|nr:type II toxin-antitoxin system RelE/ParE family toxin [Alloprevotella sp.]
MRVAAIYVSDEFRRQFRKLAKKYKSLVNDFASFKLSLEENPLQGVDLGGGVRKLRMSISAKGRGKSGGARVITLNVMINQEEEVEITLLTIYDKSEISNVSDAYIANIVKHL